MKDSFIKKKHIQFWMEEFNACHNFNSSMTGISIIQWCWPNGGSLYSQKYYTYQVFSVIKAEIEKQIAKKMKSKKNG